LWVAARVVVLGCGFSYCARVWLFIQDFNRLRDWLGKETLAGTRDKGVERNEI